MADLVWVERVRSEFAQWVLDLRAEHPGVGALLDQHMAAVRQAITSAGEQLSPPALIGYLIGFWDGAREVGWRPRPPGGPLDFATLRMSAVCLMLDSPRPA
ncbi:DUF6401 family natural product biosynthesis protein [Nonomuraea sp. NPDC050790]|uniref:DUF6401 family natural product biosynthesis protein n=1 Tax=Nonomuraea sp. NPDC050790 TaxID=3364371 RepID=UPI003789B7FC